MVHEVQASGVGRGDRVPVSRSGEADMLGHGCRDSERCGGERACTSAGVDAAAGIGKQVGSEAEREDVVQAPAGIPFPSKGVLGSKDVGPRVFACSTGNVSDEMIAAYIEQHSETEDQFKVVDPGDFESS